MADTEIKVIPEKLDRNIEDMSTLKDSIINYTPELSFTRSRGASIDEILAVFRVYLAIQGQLGELYANTEKALKMTKDSFVAVDNILENFFKALTVDDETGDGE